MRIRGWVYVITNASMPDLVKIGYSTKDPNLRAGELSSTGIPHPYMVAYDIHVEEPREIEQAVHDQLKHKNEGKEWFRCSLAEAVQRIRQTVGTRVIYEHAWQAIGTADADPHESAKVPFICCYCGKEVWSWPSNPPKKCPVCKVYEMDRKSGYDGPRPER